MPAHISVICYIKSRTENTSKNNFVVNAVDVINSNVLQLPLSVVLLRSALERTEVGITQVTIKTNIKEYLSKEETKTMSFHLYYYLNEKHLLLISKLVVRGFPLYITGHLSFMQELILVKITQINFSESSSTSSNSRSNYVSEQKQPTSVPVPPPATEIAEAILKISTRTRKRKSEPGTNTAKPKAL
ncbi:hypothetical protein Glove_23g185 [Diversispora epigaea]|uniref:Uncharacterized protein n=1 Tax=Diversispora epigaea TaxID=1348612 RepID=A0A397JTV3_9GLOM|nr:hypothetical protein Glove_23g185 [Diversispora epigaea]